MSLHDTHNWSWLSLRCFECGCHTSEPSAQLQCVPSTDDAPAEVEPVAEPRDVDWFALNRCF